MPVLAGVNICESRRRSLSPPLSVLVLLSVFALVTSLEILVPVLLLFFFSFSCLLFLVALGKEDRFGLGFYRENRLTVRSYP